jgi:DNA-binding winged helix-turn-helix (wHTH) protein
VTPIETASRVRFGPFEADLRTGELWREGSRIALQDKPFQLMLALLERPGDLVTREELRRRLWPESVFTDFEHGLNKAVNKLRRALDDLTDEPRYVETLPRRGYRFVAPVARVSSVDAVRTASNAGACRLIHQGRTYPLAAGVNLIGRDSGAVLCLDASSVSRRHAEIVVGEGAASLRDLGSKNGTYRGEARVSGEVELADGDEIRIGTVRVLFRATTRESTLTASSSAAATPPRARRTRGC